jgi:uncharacterized metal-binding protein
MPKGHTHDAITFLLAVPAAAAVYAVTKDVTPTLTIALAFVFGGLMFGPDLDTVSRQYSRWSVLRFLWFPYRRFFRHRSRFSHGLVFGALIRVIYFLGVLTVAAFAVLYVHTTYSGGKVPAMSEIALVWRGVGTATRATFGGHFFLLVFFGLWLGAASHTFTDIAGSFIKTGRVSEFL